MNPIFPTGSVLKYREADIHDVELGDIIVFEIKDDNGRTQKCFHRVIAITHYGENYAARIGTDIILKTKGDWNITMDSWVITPRNFICIVTSEDYSEFDQRAYFNELEYNGRCAGVTYLKEVDQDKIDEGIIETRERYEIIKNWNYNCETSAKSKGSGSRKTSISPIFVEILWGSDNYTFVYDIPCCFRLSPCIYFPWQCCSPYY